MLATLNLQLSPLDLHDDTLAVPASPLPETGAEARSGFAHLLRLRVDADRAAMPGSDAGLLPAGERLPHGGNMLPPLSPLQPATVPIVEPAEAGLAASARQLSAQSHGELMGPSREDLPTPKLAPGVTIRGDIGLPVELAHEEMANDEMASEHPGISLDVALVYPPPQDVPAEPSNLANTPITPPVNRPVSMSPQIRDARSDTFESGARRSTTAAPPPVVQVTSAELAARTQDFVATKGERLENLPAGVGLRDRGQQPMQEVKTSAANVATQALNVTEKILPTELARQPGPMPLQDASAIRDTLPELIQPRPAMPQMPSAHPIPQPAQAAVTAAPVIAATSESMAAMPAQQATDLIGTPVRDAAWGDQISERVVVMAGNKLKSADIRLTPAELGPLRIRVSVEDGAANVTFHAQHAVTREAIEQALPRLREMLAENGLSLGEAEVGEHGVAGQDEDGQGHDQLSSQAADESNEREVDDASRAASMLNKQNGLVDTFA